MAKAVNLNSRRGAAASRHGGHDLVVRLLQAFVSFAAVVIIVGYSYFLSSASISPLGADDAGAPGRDGGASAAVTIGYAVTVSGCPSPTNARGDFGAGISDGAAVLRHSIHLNSVRNPDGDGRYDYKMYALVHPSAESCARPALEPLGYEILLKDVPVPLVDIRGKFLREKVPKNGCCGEKEFAKLHAYTLMEHPAVVHLDLDTLVLKPLDRLFDVMINGPPADGSDGGIAVAFGDPLISRGGPAASRGSKGQIDAFFTRDYNMNHRGMKHAGVQGGFLVLRPSMKVYREFADIIREGDFREGKGWGGLGFGPFYGSMTFQGIIPYYYDHLHPSTGVELDHCVYNNMADNPRDRPTKNDVVSGSCRDGYNRPDKNDKCEDCRSRPFDDVFTTHFTLCQKPWECLPQSADRIQERLCRKFHHEWYRVREDLETSIWGRRKMDLNKADEVAKERGGGYDVAHFRGYCKSRGKNGYVKMDIPGQGVASS